MSGLPVDAGAGPAESDRADPAPRGGARLARRLAALALALLILAGAAAAAVNLWAEYHYRAALTAIEHYRLSAARDHLHQCLKVWPRSGRLNFLAARTARRLGDSDSADRFLLRAQERLGSGAEEIVLERLMTRAQDGDIDAVEPALRHLVQTGHPESVLILEALTHGYALLYDFQRVDLTIHEWLDRDPDNALAIFFRGWMREQSGAREEATRDYALVVERDPDNDEARLRLANLLLDRSQPGEALTHLEALLSRQPDNLAAKVRLARCRHDLGQLDQARDLLDDVLRTAPDYTPALTARGRLALQQGQPELAEAWLRQSAERDKADYQAVYLLHEALQRQDKQAEARKVGERMKVMETDLRRIHDIITIDLPNDRDNPELHVEAGRILLRAGDTREALRWFSQALKIDPHYPRAHEALADYFDSVHDQRRAAYHRRQAGPPRPTAK